MDGPALLLLLLRSCANSDLLAVCSRRSFPASDTNFPFDHWWSQRTALPSPLEGAEEVDEGDRLAKANSTAFAEDLARSFLWCLIVNFGWGTPPSCVWKGGWKATVILGSMLRWFMTYKAANAALAAKHQNRNFRFRR